MMKNCFTRKAGSFIIMLSLVLSVLYVPDCTLSLALDGTSDDVTDESGVIYRCITDTTSEDYGKAVLSEVSDAKKASLTSYDIKSKVTFGGRDYTVTEIGTATSNAFRDCTALTSVTIPNTVEEIDDSAFKNCTSLNSIVIPDSVEEIGDQAFFGCVSLSSITLPKKLKEIDERTFSECAMLSKVVIPDGVTKIESGAFQIISTADIGGGLKEITVPKSVISIADDAFGLNHKMTMYGYKGSYAETYAGKYDNITFVPLDGSSTEPGAVTTPTTDGKVYSNAYFSMTVPAEYLDKVMITVPDGGEPGIVVASKKCYDESNGGMGYLCRFVAYTDESYEDAPSYEIIKTSGGQTITQEDPTDTQTETRSDAAKAEYKELLSSGLLSSMIASMQVTEPPKATTIKSVKALKKKKVKVNLKNVAGVEGYEVAYSTTKKFKDYVAAGMSSTKETISHGIKAKKKYYFRARTYVFDENNNVFYSEWSPVKSVKTKK
ncbi:MAG: leucine-rich repeat domain-containing protein [Eubacterium sp.]|nr:leucine-rich repeat domain-containing protein [Eubacterium sp.]